MVVNHWHTCLHRNASSSSSVCEIKDVMDKELGEIILRRTFRK